MAPDVSPPLTHSYKAIKYKSWDIRVAEMDIGICSGLNLSFHSVEYLRYKVTLQERHDGMLDLEGNSVNLRKSVIKIIKERYYFTNELQ
jgi:hypothetical protein